ncbi:myoD family inhibitor-like isoform X2 [Hyperolius riggenbachi]|uniref:myoD family inhibitor-like isoform X2 n=1 Tax=Hyperolius riggenbachi TaxID=752182 RepID=UPI0035A2A57F
MTENAASSPEHLPATKKTARIHFADDIIVIEEGKGETVTQPPLQQILRGPQPSHKKPKTSHRLSKNKNKQQSPRLSASHIEAAAGDDSCARCLLAGLFCELSILCSALLGCVSCGLCSEGALCGSLCPDALCCAKLSPCDPGCAILDEGCQSSDCLEICLECCALCFPI